MKWKCDKPIGRLEAQVVLPLSDWIKKVLGFVHLVHYHDKKEYMLVIIRR
jgi:hypothetical protein